MGSEMCIRDRDWRDKDPTLKIYEHADMFRMTIMGNELTSSGYQDTDEPSVENILPAIRKRNSGSGPGAGQLLALYQNGERLRPDNGYPVRLFLPGYEGNISVKWLRRIKATAAPTMTKDETSKYTDLRPDGKSLIFTFPMEVKSVITSPSPGLSMDGPGLYEISGLAWSGSGKIIAVEVSADGGPVSYTHLTLPTKRIV